MQAVENWGESPYRSRERTRPGWATRHDERGRELGNRPHSTRWWMLEYDQPDYDKCRLILSPYEPHRNRRIAANSSAFGIG